MAKNEAKAQQQGAKFLRAKRGVPVPLRARGELARQPLTGGGALGQAAAGGGGVNPNPSAQPSVAAAPGALVNDVTPWFSGPVIT